MKTYQISNGVETIQVQAEGLGIFQIYPKVIETSPNFLWENITITEI